MTVKRVLADPLKGDIGLIHSCLTGEETFNACICFVERSEINFFAVILFGFISKASKSRQSFSTLSSGI